MLRFNLFTYRDFWEWINAPFENPPAEIGDAQLFFFSSSFGQHLESTT
jgi:hypothetical protein